MPHRHGLGIPPIERKIGKNPYPDSYDYGMPAAVISRAVFKRIKEFETVEGENAYTSDEFDVVGASNYQILVDKVLEIAIRLATQNESLCGLEIFNLDRDENSGNLSCLVATYTRICSNVTLSGKPTFKVKTDAAGNIILYEK